MLKGERRSIINTDKKQFFCRNGDCSPGKQKIEDMCTYSLGDKIVHPMRGAGVIENIIDQKIDGEIRSYYVLRIPIGGMIVMIPTGNADHIGVRRVMCPEDADGVIASISGMEIHDDQNWNKRYRENMDRIKSGELTEVEKVDRKSVV